MTLYQAIEKENCSLEARYIYVSVDLSEPDTIGMQLNKAPSCLATFKGDKGGKKYVRLNVTNLGECPDPGYPNCSIADVRLECPEARCIYHKKNTHQLKQDTE